MTAKGAPDISVVIPSRDREDLLRRCVDAVLGQETPFELELIIVNDGGRDPLGKLPSDPRLRVLQGTGAGPAAARNVGIGAASADVVLFTDDDTIPQPGWIDAALGAFSADPDTIGVAGSVVSPPFDPLYQHSVVSDGVGNFVTCNIAYRRADLIAVGGFDEGFPHPHCEDRDLGERMLLRGAVRYCPEMQVIHPPRTMGIWRSITRARLIESERRLHLKHPQTIPPRWTPRWGPWIRSMRGWQRALVEDRLVGGSLRRAARFSLVALGQATIAFAGTVRGRGVPRSLERVVDDRREGLRVAVVGADPEPGGGVGGCAWLIMRELAGLGCSIDLYTGAAPVDAPMRQISGLRVIGVDTGWRWDRWYSSHVLTKFASGLAARAWGRRRMARLLQEQHRYDPYDVIYQFSTIEIFGLRRHLGGLPPLVLHPSTHMAGELAGLRRERAVAARCEPGLKRLLVQGILRFRARRQRGDIKRAAHVIGISRVFSDHLIRDYGVDPTTVTVIPYPIDVHTIQASRPAAPRDVFRVLMVSRISARKGIDAIVDLSHRLDDLAGRLRIEVVGGETLWSDYRPLLAGLNPAVATYRGPFTYPQVIEELAATDVLIQPATFEPFGLTVGEALASGVPVVITDEVGAGEGAAVECCAVVPWGDLDALEGALREMVSALDVRAVEIRRIARAEAERLFDPVLVAAQILGVLVAQSPRALRAVDRQPQS